MWRSGRNSRRRGIGHQAGVVGTPSPGAPTGSIPLSLTRHWRTVLAVGTCAYDQAGRDTFAVFAGTASDAGVRAGGNIRSTGRTGLARGSRGKCPPTISSRHSHSGRHCGGMNSERDDPPIGTGAGIAEAPALPPSPACVLPVTAYCSAIGNSGAGATTWVCPMLMSPNRRAVAASTLGGGSTTAV